MRNTKPPKRPAGMTPKMEKDLREQMASNTAVMKDPAIKSVNPTFGGLAGRAVASAYMRGKASDNKKIDDMVKDLATAVKFVRSEGNTGIRGAVTPINSKQIADMARRYAQKEKSVLPEIKNLTPRQQQMVRDEIARQYKKPTTADKAKEVAKKVNKKMPSITALSIAAQNPNKPKTTNLNEVIVKPKTYRMGGALKPVPSEKKGLSKLPTAVRNKMGYMMGGGKLDMMYAKGGKLKKRGVIEDDKMRELISYGSIRPSQGVAKVDYESTLDVSNENGVSKTEYRSVGNISDDRGKAQRIVENSDGKTNTYYARKSNPTQPVKVGPSSPGKIMAGMNGRGYRDIEREVRPGISNSQSVSDLEKAKKMMYQKGGLVAPHHQTPHDPKKLAHMASSPKKLSTPYNKTKDNNSYISNDVDMSPAIKKQMMALRQAMMYFTGVSPKNK